MTLDAAVFWVMWAVSLGLAVVLGFLVCQVTHRRPDPGPRYVRAAAPVAAASPPASGSEGAGRPPDYPGPHDDTVQQPLSVYAESRISMLDDLSPAQLLEVAIYLSMRVPESVDLALAMIRRGPLELGPAR